MTVATMSPKTPRRPRSFSRHRTLSVSTDSVRNPVSKLELRFSATALINKDLFSLSDPFLVCHTVRHGEPYQEIGRTETVQDDLNPVWATTFSFDYDPNLHAASVLVVDIFDRDSPDSTILAKHDFLGRSLFRLADLLQAPHMRLDLALQPVLPSSSFVPVRKGTASTSSSLTTSADEDTSFHPKMHNAKVSDSAYLRESKASLELRRATAGSRAGKVKGTVSILAQFLTPFPGIHITFRVKTTLLRDTYRLATAICGRKVTQFYEIQRERKEGFQTSWSCVYRSEDGISVNKFNYVAFEDVIIDERILNNGQRDTNLRIAFFKRNVRKSHQLICYSSWTLEQVLDPKFWRNDVPFPMEGQFRDENGLGNVHFRRDEGPPLLTSSSSSHDSFSDNRNVVLHLRADHFLNNKFVSSLNDPPKHPRRIRQVPAFVSLHWPFPLCHALLLLPSNNSAVLSGKNTAAPAYLKVILNVIFTFIFLAVFVSVFVVRQGPVCSLPFSLSFCHVYQLVPVKQFSQSCERYPSIIHSSYSHKQWALGIYLFLTKSESDYVPHSFIPNSYCFIYIKYLSTAHHLLCICCLLYRPYNARCNVFKFVTLILYLVPPSANTLRNLHYMYYS